MDKDVSDYYRDHQKRVILTLNLLRKHIDDNVLSVANIGFSDVDHLILNMMGRRKVSFIVPEEFRPYIKANGAEYVFADIIDGINSEIREKFDLVIFTEVLEHIFAPDKDVMRNVFSLLRPGGIICFSLPNIATFANRIKLLIGKNVFWSKESQVNGVFGGYGHIREYTLKEAVDLMRDFRIIKIRGISGYRTGFKRLLNVLPASFQNTIVIIGRRV